MSRRWSGRAIGAAIVVAALSGCEYTDSVYEYVSPAFQTVFLARPLSENALQEFYEDGPRMSIGWIDGTSGTLSFDPDGLVEVTADGKTYSGNWKIRDRALCTQFGEHREVRCFRQYSDGELYDTRTGSRHGVISKL